MFGDSDQWRDGAGRKWRMENVGIRLRIRRSAFGSGKSLPRLPKRKPLRLTNAGSVCLIHFHSRLGCELEDRGFDRLLGRFAGKDDFL